MSKDLVGKKVSGLPIAYLSFLPSSEISDEEMLIHLNSINFNLKTRDYSQTLKDKNIEVKALPYYFILKSESSISVDLPEEVKELKEMVEKDNTYNITVQKAKEWLPLLDQIVFDKYNYWGKNSFFFYVVFTIVDNESDEPSIILNNLDIDVGKQTTIERIKDVSKGKDLVEIFKKKMGDTKVKIAIVENSPISDLVVDILKIYTKEYRKRGNEGFILEITINPSFIKSGALEKFTETLAEIVEV
ncbi:MAG: hypothetical protein ACTSQE_13095 [Candidatus Heimdallarchaeaceae archaeon]